MTIDQLESLRNAIAIQMQNEAPMTEERATDARKALDQINSLIEQARKEKE